MAARQTTQQTRSKSTKSESSAQSWAYFVDDAAQAKVVGDHLVLDLHSEEEGGDYDEDGPPDLASLAALRTELMNGDLRVAYLAWLASMTQDDLGEDAKEPEVPPGLSDLTEPFWRRWTGANMPTRW